MLGRRVGKNELNGLNCVIEIMIRDEPGDISDNERAYSLRTSLRDGVE